MIKAKLVLPDISTAHVTPDWLENDSESLSYIKNRTHYVETVNESLFSYPRLFDTTDTFVDMGEVSFSIAVGDVYTFKYGVGGESSFQCVAKYSIDLGDAFLGSDSAPLSEDCLFAAYIHDGHLFVASKESQSLGFMLELTESVKRLDVKYLPEYLLPSGYHSTKDVLGIKENGEVGWVKSPGNKVCHFDSYQDLPEQADNGFIAIIDSETRLTGAVVSKVLVPKNTYRLPTSQEFNYILNQRDGFAERQFRATVTGVTDKDIKGYALLPDNFNLDLLTGLVEDSYGKVLDADTYYTFNALGLVFLPCAGNMDPNRGSVYDVDKNGWYWTSTYDGWGRAFMNAIGDGISYNDNWYTYRPLSVRLVQDCEEGDFGAIRSGESSWIRFTNGNLRYEESTQVWSITRESWMFLGARNIQSYTEKVGLVDYFTFGSSGYEDRTPDVNASLNMEIAGTEYDFGVHNDIYDYFVVEGVRVYKPGSAFIYSEDIQSWEPLSGYDTLEELELPRKVEHIENVLTTKVDKVEGKGLSQNDFTDAYRAKLDGITNPIQIKGRVDTPEDLPTSGVEIGWAYLVGLEGSENFEEYVCVDETSDTPPAPVWENLGPVAKQSDWDQNNPEAPDFIKNRIAYSIPEETADVDSEIIDSSVDSYEIDQTYSLTAFTDSYKPTQEDVNKTYRVSITDKDGNKICDNKKIKAILTSTPKHNPESTGEPLHVESVCKYDSYYGTCDMYSTQITESNLLGATITLTIWDSDTGEPVDTTYTLTNENRAEDGSSDQTDGEEYLWQHVINEEYDYDAWFIYISDSSGCGLWAEYYNHVPDEPGAPTLNTIYCDSWSSIYTVTLSNQVVLDPHRVYINEFIYDIIPDIPVLTDSDLLGMTLHLYYSASDASFNITLTSDNRADSPDFGYDEENVKNWYFGTSEGVTGLIIRAYNRWEETFFELTDILSDESNQTPFDINTFYITTHNEYELPIYDFLIGPPEVIYEDQIVLPCVGTEDYHDLYETSMGFSSENGFFIISDLEEYNPSDNLPYTVDIKEITKEEDIYYIDKKYLPLDAQSDWEENDETDFSHIKNRTHYKERGTKEIQYNINNSTPHETVSIDGLNFDYYPNVILTEDLILGTIVNIEINGSSDIMTLTEQNRVYDIRDDGWYFGDYRGATVFMITEFCVWCTEEVQLMGVTFKKGFYVSQSYVGFPITYSIITNTDHIKSDIYHKIDNNYLPGYLPDEGLYGYGFKEYAGENPQELHLNFSLENASTDDFTLSLPQNSASELLTPSSDLSLESSQNTNGDYTFDMTVKYSPTIISKQNLIGHDVKMVSIIQEGGSPISNVVHIDSTNIDDYIEDITSDGCWIFGNTTQEVLFTVTDTLLSKKESLSRYFKTIIESNDNRAGTYLININNVEFKEVSGATLDYSNLTIETSETFSAELDLTTVTEQLDGMYSSTYHSPSDFIGTTVTLTLTGQESTTFTINQEYIDENVQFLPLTEGANFWVMEGIMIYGCDESAYELISSDPESELSKVFLSLLSKGSGTYVPTQLSLSDTDSVTSARITLDLDESFDWKLPYIQKISDAFLPDSILEKIKSLENSLENLPQQIEVNSFIDVNISLPDNYNPGDPISINFDSIKATPEQTTYNYDNFICNVTNGDMDTGFPNFLATQLDNLHYACLETNSILIREINPSTNITNTIETIQIDPEKIPSLQCIAKGDDGCIVVGGKAKFCARIYEENNERVIDYIEIEDNVGDYMHISAKNKDFFILSRRGNLFVYKDGTKLNKYIWCIHGIKIVKNRIYVGIQSYGDGILPNYNRGVAFSDDYGVTWNRSYYSYGEDEIWYGINYVEDLDVVVALSPSTAGKVMWIKYETNEYGICEHRLASSSWYTAASQPAYEVYSNIFAEHSYSGDVVYTRFYEKEDGTIDLTSSKIYYPKYSGSRKRQVVMSYVDTNNIVHLLLLDGSTTSYYINNTYYHIDNEDQLNTIFDFLYKSLDDGKYLFHTNDGYIVGEYKSSSNTIVPIRSWTSADDSGELSQVSYVYVKDVGDLYMQANIQISEEDRELCKYIYPELNVMHNPDELDITEDELNEILN